MLKTAHLRALKSKAFRELLIKYTTDSCELESELQGLCMVDTWIKDQLADGTKPYTFELYPGYNPDKSQSIKSVTRTSDGVVFQRGDHIRGKQFGFGGEYNHGKITRITDVDSDEVILYFEALGRTNTVLLKNAVKLS